MRIAPALLALPLTGRRQLSTNSATVHTIGLRKVVQWSWSKWSVVGILARALLLYTNSLASGREPPSTAASRATSPLTMRKKTPPFSLVLAARSTIHKGAEKGQTHEEERSSQRLGQSALKDGWQPPRSSLVSRPHLTLVVFKDCKRSAGERDGLLNVVFFDLLDGDTGLPAAEQGKVEESHWFRKTRAKTTFKKPSGSSSALVALRHGAFMASSLVIWARALAGQGDVRAVLPPQRRLLAPSSLFQVLVSHCPELFPPCTVLPPSLAPQSGTGQSRAPPGNPQFHQPPLPLRVPSTVGV
ncbi:hypothetical protein BDK51DRAFT_45810 [Blyttiomyces helicus]|uniref:Uncharacterized protein n=1 Tax=Blyttiomyces helicus TaxID=388810 RepID=A0A4P9W392_9FUNG|nr:hypothetical protein BDK51DRAFT_45810 [Blyttiomyces helicus]|eukprot:RKO85815.1 hypothetical protein BDK51DRAFT_45810 [Blyttiomyces helicus]